MKKSILTLFLLIPSIAFAWGPNEQGILTGIVGTIIYQEVTKPKQQQQVIVVEQPRQVIVEQPPLRQVCKVEELFDRYGRYVTSVDRCYYTR